MKLFKNLWAKEARANTVSRPLCHCLDAQKNHETKTRRRISPAARR
jgi:hypothetical protein